MDDIGIIIIVIALLMLALQILYFIWREKREVPLQSLYKQKLEQWERDGYDVSGFKKKWFDSISTAHRKIDISLLNVLLLVVTLVALSIGGWTIAAGHFPPWSPTPKYTLTTSVSPLGSGSISLSSGNYNRGETLTLTAYPSSDYEFDHWGGDASGYSSSTSLQMSSNKSVTAYFVISTKATPTPTVTPTMTPTPTPTPAPTPIVHLTTSVSPPGAGSVSPGSGTYDSGTLVTLIATPASGYQFANWTGDVANPSSASTTVTVNSDKAVVANFTKLYQRIEYTMPPGAWAASEVIYSKVLRTGDEVDGSVQLTGEYHQIDWSTAWTFQILGPRGENIQPVWLGTWDNNYYHEFSFSASYTGTYKIRVIHYSNYYLNLKIEIWPPGWGYSGS